MPRDDVIHLYEGVSLRGRRRVRLGGVSFIVKQGDNPRTVEKGDSDSQNKRSTSPTTPATILAAPLATSLTPGTMLSFPTTPRTVPYGRPYSTVYGRYFIYQRIDAEDNGRGEQWVSETTPHVFPIPKVCANEIDRRPGMAGVMSGEL